MGCQSCFAYVVAALTLSVAGGCSPAFAAAVTPSHPRTAIAAPPAVEGPRIELTLPEAVALGLRENRTIQSAYIDRVAQKFDLIVSEDRFSPRLLMTSSDLVRRDNGAAGRSDNATATVSMVTPLGTQIALSWLRTSEALGGVPRSGSTIPSLAVIQPLLLNAGRDVNMAPVQIARLTEQVNRLTLKTTVSQAITDIITAYRSLILAHEQARIAKEALARSRQLMEVNRALIASGRMAAEDIIQTEADVANQELSVSRAKNVVDTARLALLTKLALDPRMDLIPTEHLSAEHVDINADHALAIAFENQPEYLSQIIAVEQARINLRVAENQRLIDVSVVGGVGGNSQGGLAGINPKRNSYAGIQITIPIGDLTYEQAEVTTSAAVKAAEVRLDSLRQQIEQQIRDAVHNVDATWEQYHIAYRARDLAERKVSIEREKLKYGRSSNFQVLTYEGDLRVAESMQISSILDYLNALTTLDYQVGKTLETWKISLED